MSGLTLGIIAGLTSALGFGVGDYFAAKSSRDYNAIYAAFWSQVLQFGLILVIFVALGWKWRFAPVELLLAPLYGATFFAGLTCAWQAFKRGPVSIASAFVSMYALVAAIIGLIFLHEHLTSSQGMAVLILVAGAVLCSLGQKIGLSGSFWRHPTVRYAILGALGIGASIAVIGVMVRTVGWQNALILEGVGSSGCGAILMKLRGVSFRSNQKPLINRHILLAVIFFELGGVALSYGFSVAPVAIVAPVASISPLLTVGLSIAFFKERLSAYQIAGILCIVGSLVVLAMR